MSRGAGQYQLLVPFGSNAEGSRVSVASVFRSRRFLVVACLVALVSLSLFYRDHLEAKVTTMTHASAEWGMFQWPEQVPPGAEGYRRRPSWGVLRSQGTKAKLKDNLREEKRYFMAFPGAGFNNQAMGTMNIIYFAHRNGRIPVLPSFWPNGQHYNERLGSDVPVGDIFDLTHVRAVLNDLPIVEMHELKPGKGIPPRWRRIIYDGEFPQNGTDGEPLAVGDWILPVGIEVDEGHATPRGIGEKEVMSCWSFWQNTGNDLRGVDNAYRVNVSTDLTPLPPKCYHHGRGSFSGKMPEAAWIMKQPPLKIPPESLETLQTYNYTLPLHMPDKHLQCLELAYFFQDQPERYDLHGEWRRGFGTWAAVGQFMHWRQELVDLASRVARNLLGVGYFSAMPPYIAIHIRRGDFSSQWQRLTPRDYAYIAHGVMSNLYHNKGIRIKHVLVMTEERDPEWLQPLKDYGFVLAQHQDLGIYDPTDTWLPLVVDMVLMGQAKGFVGCSSSTMSILSSLRCRDWANGVAEFIPDADHIVVPEEWEWSWDPAP